MEAEKTKKKVRMPETGKRAMKQKVLPKKLPELKEQAKKSLSQEETR